jgi:hypothetical protein
MSLLERAAKSSLEIRNVKLTAFKGKRPDQSNEPQSMCLGGRDAEKMLAVFSGGNGYVLKHRGEKPFKTDGKQQKLETCDIHREGTMELIGEAEILRDATDDKPVLLAFEINAPDIMTVSRLARAVRVSDSD